MTHDHAASAAVQALPRVYPTVVGMLADAAGRDPRAEALVCGERHLDYAGYLGCVAGFAAELDSLGARGERVATLLPNSIDACIAAFGALAAGAQHVPLNPLLAPREIDFILRDASPVALIVDEALAATLAPIAAGAGIRHLIVVGPQARRLDHDCARTATLPVPPAPDALALLQYTGGTTGRPKGVDLTHRSIAINVSQREALLPSRAGDRIICVMPISHAYGMAMGLFLAAYCGGALVILPRYVPDEVLATVTRERITVFPGSPTVFVGLMAHPDFPRTDWNSVHTCYSGAAPLSAETLRRWRDAVGAPVHEGYGQTEAGPVLSFNPVGRPIKPGSVGVAVPLTEIEIVDIETGRTVLVQGERGEIRARGPQCMAGYRNLPAETAEALRDGWLYTGDVGEFDTDGYLYIRDRKKDMAIVGGYNVYPREVEEALFLHPDVIDAAVAGTPDAYRGEALIAWVVLRGGARAQPDELVAHCHATLARYKVPARIEIVDALPKTSANKTDRNALRARASAGAARPSSSPEPERSRRNP
ncbi:MAG: long-chain fatty acid--CoA ligase [Burkholderiales bacterium]|nr:MAG: long-chain fatty acid--CoA ligase [Burkholderiales bacterium]